MAEHDKQAEAARAQRTLLAEEIRAQLPQVRRVSVTTDETEPAGRLLVVVDAAPGARELGRLEAWLTVRLQGAAFELVVGRTAR